MLFPNVYSTWREVNRCTEVLHYSENKLSALIKRTFCVSSIKVPNQYDRPLPDDVVTFFTCSLVEHWWSSGTNPAFRS